MMLAVWLFYLANGYVALLVAMTYLPILLTMRAITRKDDQRLRQVILRIRMRHRQILTRRLWGAVSYSPIRYKQRNNHEI